MTRWMDDLDRTLGRGLARTCLVAVVLGIAAFVWGALSGQAPRVFAALIASWLFFAGAAMGALAFLAVLELAGARWSRGLGVLASAVSNFVPLATLLLILIVVGLASWAPWFDQPVPGQSFWLNVPFFSARELLSTVALFGFAYLGMRRGDGPVPGVGKYRSSRVLVAFCLMFAVVLSFWAFDFVLGQDLEWSSTLIGPHVFVGAAASGASLIVLYGLATGRLGEKMRSDLGALLLTLSVLWGYLFWSQFFTIWYGNLPSEIEFVLRRSHGGWKMESVVVIVLSFVVPFVLLLGPRGKRNPRVLASAAASQLLGLWLERHLLVVPSLSAPGVAPFDLCGALVALGIGAAFLLTTVRTLRAAPMVQASEVSRG
jgi:Ni/Fe-hydrogenase subunit HybB-like protein